MSDFETKFKSLIDKEIQEARGIILEDLEAGVASIVYAIFQGDPRLNSDIREPIADFLDYYYEFPDSLQTQSFRELLSRIGMATKPFEKEVRQALKATGIVPLVSFGYKMNLLGKRGAQLESRLDSFKDDILDLGFDLRDRWHVRHDNFFESYEGRCYFDTQVENGADPDEIYQYYYESDEYEEWYSTLIDDLDLEQLGGMDEIISDATDYSDLDEFVEDTVRQSLPEIIEDGYAFSEISGLSDFEFEIGMTVNMDMASQDRARSAVSVLNDVVRYVKEAQSAIERVFKIDTQQLNLFTGEVDLIDLGSAIRIVPDVRVCMQEVIDVGATPRAKMSPTFEQIARLLTPEIVTEYQAILWSSDETYQCELDIQYTPDVVSLLTQNGLDCTVSCASEDTVLQYAPNALAKTEVFVLEEFGVDPLTILESDGLNTGGFLQIVAAEYPSTLDIERPFYELTADAYTVRDCYAPLNEESPATIRTTRILPHTWRPVKIVKNLFSRGDFPVSLYSLDLLREMDTLTRRYMYSRDMDEVVAAIVNLSRNAAQHIAFPKFFLVANSRRREGTLHTGKDKPNTLRTTQANKVRLICANSVAVYADLTHILNQDIDKVGQSPNAENALILYGKDTVPCDVVLVSANVDDGPLDISSLRKKDQDTALVVDIDAPDDEIATLQIEMGDRHGGAGIYTLNPRHYLIQMRSFGQSGLYLAGDQDDVSAYLGQVLDDALGNAAFSRDLSSLSGLMRDMHIRRNTHVIETVMPDLLESTLPWVYNGRLSFGIDDESRIKLEERILDHENFGEFVDLIGEAEMEVLKSRQRHKMLRILGLADATFEMTNEEFSRGESGSEFRLDFEFEPAFKLAKNVNLLATSNLAYVIPQIIGRFEEHVGEHIALNNAPLGAAMDMYMGRRVESPNQFLADPESSVFVEAFKTGNIFATSIRALDDIADQLKYLGGIRYLYSFIDFYTKPLAILYNVLYYPDSYIRENPFVKGRKLLAATYSLKPSTWLKEYKDALAVSQKDMSWSHLAKLDSAAAADIERELDLWDDHATIYEFDDLFDENGVSKIDMFTTEESYFKGEDKSILPYDLQGLDIWDELKCLEAIQKPIIYREAHVREDLHFTDPFGTARYGEFSRKLNASINIFARNWTFNIAPLIGEDFYSSAFYDTYVKGSNPNVSHVANISDLFKFGVMSPGLKKIFDNKRISAGGEEKVPFCEANMNQNAMPYQPMRHALRFFPRVKGSKFGNLPSEDPTTTTSKERVSLGAYMLLTNLAGITYKYMNRAEDTGEFGPSVFTTNSSDGDVYTLTQCTGFPKSKNIDTLVPVSKVSDGSSEVKERLNAISRDYNICIGYHTSPNYSAISASGKGDVFTIFDDKMHMFACAFYTEGALYEIKGEENAIFGGQPSASRTLTAYGSYSGEKVATLIDLRRAQTVINFLMYAHNYDSSKYRFKMVSDVIQVASVVIPNFDLICKQEGIRRMSRLPDTFVSEFCEALVDYLNIPDIDDPVMYITDNYLSLNVDQYLPSLYFTQMRSYLSNMQMYDRVRIREYIENGDTYFGAIDKSVVDRIRKFSSNEALAGLLRQNETFDLEGLVAQPTTSELIEASVRAGEHYYPTKS